MRSTFIILTLLICCTLKFLNAQSYIGGGQTNGVTVESSDQHNDPNWYSPANAINTINVVNVGFEAWINQQIQIPYNENTIWDKTYSLTEQEWPSRSYFDHAWWDYMMKNEDLLRHRVAMALSEIFVISRRVFNIDIHGDTPAAYYDMLAKNALGNFEDLLLDVTLGCNA